MNDNEMRVAIVRWVFLFLMSIVLGVTIYQTAVDVRWEPKIEQRYVHAHGGQ